MFETVLANDAGLRQIVHELRYQVYVAEKRFERREDNPGGLETDQYDDHSVHALLYHRPTRQFAGTVRLVLPSPHNFSDSFPIQQICPDEFERRMDGLPMDRVGEISRFCISGSFRKLVAEAKGHDVPSDGQVCASIYPQMMVDLVGAIVRMCVHCRITHVFAVMEPQLLRVLSWAGAHFDPIGSLVDYHGRRQPCMQHFPSLLDRVRSEKPLVWKAITDGGRLSRELWAIDSEQPAARYRPRLSAYPLEPAVATI